MGRILPKFCLDDGFHVPMGGIYTVGGSGYPIEVLMEYLQQFFVILTIVLITMIVEQFQPLVQIPERVLPYFYRIFLLLLSDLLRQKKSDRNREQK